MKNNKSLILVNFVHDKYLEELATLLQSETTYPIVQAGYADLLSQSRKIEIDFSQVDNPEKIDSRLLKKNNFAYNSDYEAQESRYLGMFLNILSRTTLGRFDVNICNFYFRFLTNYFRGEIDKIKPKLVVFDSTPHMPTELCLFIASKQLGVKTIYPSRIHVGPRVIFLEDLPYFKPIPKTYNENSGNVIIPSISPWLKRSMHQNQENDKNIKSLFNFNIGLRTWANLKLFLKYAKKSLKIVIQSRWEHHYFYLSKSESVKFLILNFYKFRRQISTIMKEASTEYNTHHPEQYCCFMLQYQPERSTMPEAFEFSDQISSLLYLRSVLPSKIPILVKEHPKQLRLNPGNPRPLQYRSTLFYKLIASMENVFLLEPTFNSDKLLPEAKLVSSATGSAIWEALNLGVPCLSFARNWLSDFKFAPFIFDLDTKNGDIEKLMSSDKELIKREFEEYKLEQVNYATLTLDSQNVTANYSNDQIRVFKHNYVEALKLAYDSACKD